MKKSLILILLSLLVISFFLFDLKTGDLQISFKQIFLSLLHKNTDLSKQTIILQLRIPRIITAIIIGIALPLSGLLLQTLLRNPLAGPYILGISSGASLGVALMLLGASSLGFSSFFINISANIAGIAGAMFVLLIILFISNKISDNSTILIIGIFIGSGIGAIVDLLQYFSKADVLKKYIIWTMGSLEGVSNQQLTYFVPLVLIILICSFLLVKYFDALYLGEDNAKTIGVNIKLIRIAVFVISGILTGIITALCGPIGFIGIAVPHLARMLFKTASHLWLIAGSSLIGILLMLVSDIIAHSAASQIVPINTITALWGIPIIIWIVVKNK